MAGFGVLSRRGVCAGLGLAGGICALAFAAAPHGTVSIGILYTNGNVKIHSCSGGFDIQGGADLHFASSDRRVDGEIADGHLSEVANSADEAYVQGHGTLRAHGHKSPMSLYAVDHGNFLNGVYLIRLADHAGVLVGNTSSHQDQDPILSGAPHGHGTVGRVGDVPPTKNAVLVLSSCSAAGARMTGTPVNRSGEGQTTRPVTGSITTTYSHLDTRRCRVGSLTRETARTVLRGSDPLASGVLTLGLTVRSNGMGASTVTGSGTMRALHGTKVIGRGSLLAAAAGAHSDGIYAIRLTDRPVFLALNETTVQASSRNSSGAFGRSSPHTAQDIAVIAPERC